MAGRFELGLPRPGRDTAPAVARAPLGSGPLVIHALPVGGGILALSGLPGAGGDYRADLEHVAAWAPALVVSLATEAEMVEAGGTRLGQDLQDRGTRWVHMPLRDYAAPDAAMQADWRALGANAQRALAGGGRVLIHCRAGCGRSGMAALRLMIECGEAPDEALARLRAVRPCAVETGAQMAWAMAARRKPARFLRRPGPRLR